MKISALIVDDEPLARKFIANLLLPISDIEVIAQCRTGKDAIKMIDELTPKIIFLDIKLKDMTGFDVLHNINTSTPPLIIFVTAFDSYAIEAFNFFAFDYLLKPFTENRFYLSVNKAIESIKRTDTSILQKKISSLLNYIQSSTANDSLSVKKHIPISLKNRTIFVDPDQVMYIKASSYYAEIYTQKEKYILRESLHNLANDLRSRDFMRIHRSTIINTRYILEMRNLNYGEIDVLMCDRNRFKVSKTYKKEFLKRMGLQK